MSIIFARTGKAAIVPNSTPGRKRVSGHPQAFALWLFNGT